MTAPTNEIGYAQVPMMSASGRSSMNWWMVDDETTPELRWPQSVYVYDQMRTQDSQVKSVLQAVTTVVRRTPWRIDPAGARAEVVQLVAEDLGLPILGQDPTPLPRAKDRFSWSDHLREALLMLPFGHMYFEQVYRIVNDQARLRKLGARMPKTIEEIDVARDGGLISITQYGVSGGYQERAIPVNRLVAYINEKEGGNWLGRSILRPAYKNWLIKDRLLRVQAQTIERNGMGIPVYKAAPTEQDLSKGLGLAMSLRAGEAAGAAIPAEALLELMGVKGQLPDAEPAIRYHDEQIARAVLAHFLNLGTQTGSWALGSTFADFFTLSLQTLAQQIADTATQHIVEDIVDLNWGEDEPAPKVIFDEIGSRQAATAEAIKALIDARVITADEVLEGAVRQQFGLPPRDELTERKPQQETGPAPQKTPETQPDERPGSVAAAADPKAVTAHTPGGHQHNQQSHGNDVGVDVVKNPLDKLNLAGRIDLKPGEKLLSSQRIRTRADADGWDLMTAEVDAPKGRQVRLGIIYPDDSKHWAAGPDPKRAKRIAELDAEIDRLENGPDLSDAEIDRLEELQSERGDIREFDEGNLNRTATTDPASVAKMRSDIEAGIERARSWSRAWKKLSDEYDEVQADRDMDPNERERRLARIEERFSALGDNDQYFLEGSIPGGPEGDLHYLIGGIDDGEGGWKIELGIKPPDAEEPWYIGEDDDKARFEGSDVKKLLKALQGLESGTGVVAGAVTVTAHLKGLHDQSRHGRRFRIPGDPSSGLRSKAEPEAPMAALARMRANPVSGDRERVDAILATMSHQELDAVAVEFGIQVVRAPKAEKRRRLVESLVGFRLDWDAIMNVGNRTGPDPTREEAEQVFRRIADINERGAAAVTRGRGTRSDSSRTRSVSDG